MYLLAYQGIQNTNPQYLFGQMRGILELVVGYITRSMEYQITMHIALMELKRYDPTKKWMNALQYFKNLIVLRSKKYLNYKPDTY